MKLYSSLFLPLFLLLGLSLPAQARIYMYIDADGHKGATDRREAVPAGARVTSVIDTGGGSDSGGSAPRKSGNGKTTARTPSPANFPRIDSGTQKKRDDVRRSILEEELASERKNVDEARRRLSMGEKPLAGENVTSPAHAARVKQLRDAVQLHERNIAAIQKELGAMR